jgi:hypothetical protein
MNTVNLKFEILGIVEKYLDRHPASAAFTRRRILDGHGEEAVMSLIIEAIKSNKGGAYKQYAASFEDFIEYLEEKLCLVLCVDEVAKRRRVHRTSELNRLAILLAYCVLAKHTGGFCPPECSMPELAILFTEGGVR